MAAVVVVAIVVVVASAVVDVGAACELEGAGSAAVVTGVEGVAAFEAECFPRDSATMPRTDTTTMTLATRRVRSTAAR